jgi:N-acyl homoserine lactone hydrolase
MTASRMFMLEYGVEKVPKSLSVLGGGSHTLLTPIYGAVVETPDGWVLLDTGISRRALADPQALTEIYGADMHPCGPEGWGHDGTGADGPGLDADPLATALSTVGLSVADISLAAVSHLHLDHTGGVPLLAAAGVPIVIQRCELDYGMQRAANSSEREVAFYRTDYLGADVDWRFTDGDAEIAPGIRVMSTPGHTPGHQSFLVDLVDTGTWILSADAADLGENLLERIPCGWTAEQGDVPKAKASINRLVDEAERLDARLVPGHDSVFWKAIWHPTEGHR